MDTPTHHLVIEPTKGVGPIHFGMHKDEVSRAFTYVVRSFFKTSESKVRSDDFEAVGLIIHYDHSARVNYIEVTQPSAAKVSLELFGQEVSGISVEDAVKLLSSHCAEFSKDSYGYSFPALGITTFNSDLESSLDKVESFGLSPKIK
jgi:hypothetical protein